MKYLSFILSLFVVFFVFLFVHLSVEASTLPVITVINPLREPNMVPGTFQLASLQNQWQVTHAYGIHATWLWQYTTLEDKKLIDFAKTNMKDQEFGLFLEIDKNFAQKAGVQYRGQGPWYFSDGLLLVSYDASEREKLIDTAFATFKTAFGFYPKTVGAWWLSADSLTYMQKKYRVVAALRAADQFNLDAYSIWGTPWSIPYIASINNAGIPASTLDNSSKVVIMQWAPRDPTRAYGSTFEASTYSMQDYSLKKYDLSYFDYLTHIFLQKPLDQVVMGLEGGFASYDGQYQQQLAQAADWQKNNKLSILPASEYARRFLDSQQTIAPTHYFLTKDFQSDNQSFWYNSSAYRVGVEKEGDEVYLVDARNYATNKTEDFLTLPNSQGFLRISEPAIIDSARIPSQKKLLTRSNDMLHIKTARDSISLFAGNTQIALFTPTTFTFAHVPNADISHTKSFSINIFILLIGILLLDGLLIFFLTKNTKQTLFQVGLLFVPLLFAYPFLAKGNMNDMVFIFDRKELLLLSIPFLSSLPIFVHLLLLQIAPFVLLFVAQYFFILKKAKFGFLYYVFLALVTLFFAHTFYFPLDKSTMKIFAGFIGVIAFMFCGIICIVFYRTRKLKSVLLSLTCSGFLLIGIIITVVFSRQQFVLTPFEIDALQVVTKKHESVIYLASQNKLIYKTVHPVLYDYPKLAKNLSGVAWQQVSVLPNNVDGKLIVISRYLGADISADEIQKRHLQVIFDNAQIAILEKK